MTGGAHGHGVRRRRGERHRPRPRQPLYRRRTHVGTVMNLGFSSRRHRSGPPPRDSQGPVARSSRTRSPTTPTTNEGTSCGKSCPVPSGVYTSRDDVDVDRYRTLLRR